MTTTDNYDRIISLVTERLKWATTQIENDCKAADKAAEESANADTEVQVMLQSMLTLYKSLKAKGLRVELVDEDKKIKAVLRKDTFSPLSPKIVDMRKAELDKVRGEMLTGGRVVIHSRSEYLAALKAELT